MFSMKKWQWHHYEKGTRYYRLCLQQDLWGDWEIVRINGRRQSRLGATRCLPVKNYRTALKTLQDLCRYRQQRRHYQLVKESHPLCQDKVHN